MPTSSEGLRTVGVSFAKLVPDEGHVVAIRDAVDRVHKATLLTTELLNLYVRDRLQNHAGSGLDLVCDANWPADGGRRGVPPAEPCAVRVVRLEKKRGAMEPWGGNYHSVLYRTHVITSDVHSR